MRYLTLGEVVELHRLMLAGTGGALLEFGTWALLDLRLHSQGYPSGEVIFIPR
jgi:hypothetical protein